MVINGLEVSSFGLFVRLGNRQAAKGSGEGMGSLLSFWQRLRRSQQFSPRKIRLARSKDSSYYKNRARVAVASIGEVHLDFSDELGVWGR